jgi:hypothetical protein
LKTPISTSIPPGLSSETTFSVVVDSFAPYTGTAVFHAQKNA